MTDNKITSLTEENFDKVKEVYKWSSLLTAESKSWEPDYIWTEPIRRLANKLRFVKGSLIGLVGLQGVGKSEALKQLRDALSNEKRRVILIKWPGGFEPFDELFQLIVEQEHGYADTLYQEIKRRALPGSKMLRKIHARLESVISYSYLSKYDWDNFKNKVANDWESLEEMFTIRERKELRKEWLLETLSTLDTIFIDTRDYSKSDQRLMNTDLMGIQRLWSTIIEFNCEWSDEEQLTPNFVVAFQKELFYGPKGISHFLLGKMETYELKPLTPQQLYDVYIRKFNDPYPFQKEALMRLARLSRGIPRRYLKYISLCLETWMNCEEMPSFIDIHFTEKAITNEEISKDMDLELSSLFPKSEEMKKKAIKIISYLINAKESLNQKQLANALNLNEMDCSRLCDKLEEHGYVIRESSKEGKIVRANI